MKGFMRKRGASWELRVFLGYDPVTGKQRYASRTVRGGKRDAQRVLAEMVTEAERGLTPRSASTVGELLEAWFELAAADFSPTTVKETRGFIDRSLLPGLGERKLAKLKPAEIDTFYQHLRTAGGVGGRPLAPSTIRRIHGILRRALAQGVKWGWIGVNPAASASPPKVPPPDITPPDPEQLARLLVRAREESPELACYVLLAAVVGARRSEMVALRWSDVDLDGFTITIRRGVVLGSNGLVEKDTKTHSSRRVSLDGGSAAVLAEHKEQMESRAVECGMTMAVDGFVFSNEPDGSAPWFPGSVSRSFKRLCVREGVGHVRLHDLRHFVATQLLGAGVDVRTVAGRLGHRNSATTLNVYAHFLEQSDRAAADVIGNLLLPRPGSPD
ncbi:MAG: site-specific integrase [bacterium]|nr:site-specific integrase [bacterium]